MENAQVHRFTQKRSHELGKKIRSRRQRTKITRRSVKNCGKLNGVHMEIISKEVLRKYDLKKDSSAGRGL